MRNRASRKFSNYGESANRSPARDRYVPKPYVPIVDTPQKPDPAIELHNKLQFLKNNRWRTLVSLPEAKFYVLIDPQNNQHWLQFIQGKWTLTKAKRNV